MKATEEAYTTYAINGYDKVGDKDTDFLGTTPSNATSVDEPGFRSNDDAKATYNHNEENEEIEYPHPVIQVSVKTDIVKIDQNGHALEGAIFNLYNGAYDPSKSIEENEDHLIIANLQSKIPQDGQEAVIHSGKLTVGTYYLVEVEAPDGYYGLSGPVKITVTDDNGILNMTAEIAGVSVGDKLVKVDKGFWQLKLQNNVGYELPETGGVGKNSIILLGAILVVLAGTGLAWMRKKRGEAA